MSSVFPKVFRQCNTLLQRTPDFVNGFFWGGGGSWKRYSRGPASEPRGMRVSFHFSLFYVSLFRNPHNSNKTPQCSNVCTIQTIPNSNQTMTNHQNQLSWDGCINSLERTFCQMKSDMLYSLTGFRLSLKTVMHPRTENPFQELQPVRYSEV